jgi:hypothetical protein
LRHRLGSCWLNNGGDSILRDSRCHQLAEGPGHGGQSDCRNEGLIESHGSCRDPCLVDCDGWPSLLEVLSLPTVCRRSYNFSSGGRLNIVIRCDDSSAVDRLHATKDEGSYGWEGGGHVFKTRRNSRYRRQRSRRLRYENFRCRNRCCARGQCGRAVKICCRSGGHR